MTRAEKKLYMTFAAERMIHGERKSSIPSRFVKEIPGNLIETDNSSGYTSKRETAAIKGFEPRATSSSLDKNPVRLKSGSVAIPQNTAGRFSSRVNIPRKKERDRRPTFGRAFPSDCNIKRSVPNKSLNESGIGSMASAAAKPAAQVPEVYRRAVMDRIIPWANHHILSVRRLKTKDLVRGL